MPLPLIELQQGNMEIDRIAKQEWKDEERERIWIEFNTDKSINTAVSEGHRLFYIIACMLLGAMSCTWPKINKYVYQINTVRCQMTAKSVKVLCFK